MGIWELNPVLGFMRPASCRLTYPHWWRRWDLNPLPSVCKTDALPAELHPLGIGGRIRTYTGLVLNQAPLPIGLRRHILVGQVVPIYRENPHFSVFEADASTICATGPQLWSRRGPDLSGEPLSLPWRSRMLPVTPQRLGGLGWSRTNRSQSGHGFTARLSRQSRPTLVLILVL